MAAQATEVISIPRREGAGGVLEQKKGKKPGEEEKGTFPKKSKSLVEVDRLEEIVERNFGEG